MSDLEKRFKEMAEKVRTKMGDASAAAKYSTEDKTKVYALYKQATQGDVTGSQPWAFEFESRTKWDGWNALKGMPKDIAMQKYIVFSTEKLGV